MRWVLGALAAVALLAGCASGDGPTDQAPRIDGHHPAAGFRTVSFHGASLDVPETAQVVPEPACGEGLPTAGALVAPLFDGGPVNCPAHTGSPPPPPPRPADRLTVLLTATGSDVDITLPAPRRQQLPAAGVTVLASGPAAQVDTVFASTRVGQQDDLGCVDHIDPTVAPRNGASTGASLLPVATRRIVVCEYGRTGDDGRFWLVGSRRLSDAETATQARRIDASRDAIGAGGLLDLTGPVLRLLVLGADGTTRTLQTPVGGSAGITDGRRAVVLAQDPDGNTPPLPTPFDRP